MNKALIESLKNEAELLEETKNYLWRSQHTKFSCSLEIEAGFEKIAEGLDEVIKALEEQEK